MQFAQLQKRRSSAFRRLRQREWPRRRSTWSLRTGATICIRFPGSELWKSTHLDWACASPRRGGRPDSPRNKLWPRHNSALHHRLSSYRRSCRRYISPTPVRLRGRWPFHRHCQHNRVAWSDKSYPGHSRLHPERGRESYPRCCSNCSSLSPVAPMAAYTCSSNRNPPPHTRRKYLRTHRYRNSAPRSLECKSTRPARTAIGHYLRNQCPLRRGW